MNYYDYKKAKKLIEQYKNEIVSASLGMRDDWWWTAETVWENGEYKKTLFTGNLKKELVKYKADRSSDKGFFQCCDDYEHILIGGIPGSGHDIPTLSLEYADGKEVRFSVSKEMDI